MLVMKLIFVVLFKATGAITGHGVLWIYDKPQSTTPQHDTITWGMLTTSTLVLAHETAISENWQTCLDLVDPLAAGGEELLIICLHVHHLTMVGFHHSIINF